MNMLARKLKLAPINGADVLAVLDRRIAELVARRLVLSGDIIAVESSGGAWRESDGHASTAQAEELLVEGAEFIAPHPKPPSALAMLYAERDAIDLALKIGRSRQHRLATERAGQIYAQYYAEIGEIELERVLLGVKLQRVDRLREVLRTKIADAGGGPVILSTDGKDLLGFGDVHDEVAWAVNRIVTDGIATSAEIEKVKRDG